MQLKYVILVALISAGLGGLSIYSFYRWGDGLPLASLEQDQENKDILEGQRDLINPLLFCGRDESKKLIGQAPFESSLKKTIEGLLSDESVEDVSVVFRDLNNGPVYSFNRDKEFRGASLLKIFLLIGYLKVLEREPHLNYAKIKYDPNKHDLKNFETLFPADDKMIPGQAYSISELLERMITNSDNSALIMLADFRPDAGIEETLKKLNFLVINKNNDTWITNRTYASILRILYNSTFLSREYSNLALHLLAKSKFQKGLVAGLPKDLLVAHKFGERFTIDGAIQLHDCGIVYRPGQPYLLCIMTQGKNKDRLARAIQTITEAVDLQVRKSVQ